MSEAVSEAMVQVNGRVPVSLRKRLKLLAVQNETSVEHEMREAIRLYLDEIERTRRPAPG